MFDRIIEQLHALPTGAKGRRFEELARWYLQHAPEYRHLIKHVYAWAEWPGRWGADAGIDLVAVLHTGDLWAVQAKAYAPEYAIKKSDVDSFLSESNRRNFSFRLLVATTNRIGANAARTVHQQEKAVGLTLLSQLRHALVKWPEDLNELRASAPVRISPYPHQVEARDAVVRGLRAGGRGQLVMACGTGKTLTGLWIDEGLESRRTLVIVPSLSLLGQTLRTWTAQANIPFSYLAACSDETVASSDSFTAWTSDLGVPVTTNAEAIRAFLVGHGERCVVFSTYHSSPVVAAAQDAGAPGFDLVIADEAHRAAGRVDAAFGTVLDAQRIRAARRLFMTATPRFVSGRVLAAARERDLEITSMDDVATFGPVLHKLPFRQAIERGLLSDYRVVVIGVNDPGIGRTVERRELVRTEAFTMDAETLARQVGLLRAVDRFQLRRVLTFHSRKAAARSFAGVLPAVVGWLPSDARPPGRLWAQHITGDMSAGEREVILDQLRSLDNADWGVLSNVRCVAEGVDVPTLDGVVFIDPRRSQIDVVQAVGRAIRRSAAKKLGIVVIPVFVPSDADEEDMLDLSDFRIVWDVVRALRAHDDVLAEQLDEARFQIGRRAGLTELPGKVILDLPRGVTAGFARALSARIVQATTSAFEFWFGLLLRYVEAHGTAASIEHRTEVDGYRLGAWVTNQRVLHGSGRLKAERASRLESVTGWAWRRKEAQQAFGFWVELLRRYVDEHGTAAKVDRNTVMDGYNLGEWATATRARHSRGAVSADRVAQLEAVPGWVWSKNDANWDRMFELLKNYVAREGHAAVRRAHIEDGEPLGKWVANLRNTYKGVRPGILTPERIASLEAQPGWAWDRRDAIFEQGYSALLSFADREGHAVVPEGHVENGVLLQAWINRQRHDHTTGRIQRLGANRVTRLEAIPGWRWRRVHGERTRCQ